MKLFESRVVGLPRARSILTLLEVGLVLALAVQSARLIWIAAPLGPFGAQVVPASPPASTPAKLAILDRFDPFFRTGGASTVGPNAQSGLASGGVTLSGVRADGAGGGSAILRLGDGREASFAVGDKVEGGFRLLAVANDHVILSLGGTRKRIGFPAPMGVATTLPTADSGPGPQGDASLTPTSTGVGAAEFLAAAALSPRLKEGRPAGYRVTPRGGGDALARAGLRAGDVLLALDGSELNPERLSELPDQLAKADHVELRFERDGQVMTTRVRISSQ